MIQRAADTDVAERLLQGVDRIGDDARARHGEDRRVAGAQLLHLRDRRAGDDVDAPRAELRGAGARIGDRAEDEPLGRRLAAPVVGVGLEHDPLAALPFHEAVGSGAERLARERVHADLRVGARQDVQAGEVEDQRRERGFRRDLDRLGIDDACALRRPQVGVDRAPLVGELGVDRELHVLRRQRIAVVELHAAPQGEAPRRRIRVLPADGQHRLEPQVGPGEVDEGVVEMNHHVVRHHGLRALVRRVEREGSSPNAITHWSFAWTGAGTIRPSTMMSRAFRSAFTVGLLRRRDRHGCITGDRTSAVCWKCST